MSDGLGGGPSRIFNVFSLHDESIIIALFGLQKI